MLGLKDDAAPMIRNSPLQKAAINYSLASAKKAKEKTNKQRVLSALANLQFQLQKQ